MMNKKMTNFRHLFVVVIMSCKIKLYFGIYRVSESGV